MYLRGRIFRLLLGVAVLFGVIGLGWLVMSRPVSATSGINEHINFQGRLFNAQGATVPDGNYNIQFKIYQDGAGTAAGNPGGTLLWTESWLNSGSHGVQIKNGYLSVELGTVTPFGSNVDWNQDTLWLSMNIGDTTSCTITTNFTSDCSGDGEMVPMKRMSSTPYSLNSGRLGGLTSAQYLQLAQGAQTDASNVTSLFVNKTGTGNIVQLQSSSTDVFTVSNSGNLAFGANSDHTISVTTAAAGTGGYDLTVSAGTGGSGTGSTGGDIVLQGGAGGGTDGNGGNIVINAGAKTGTGTDGSISIGTSNTASITLGASTALSANKDLTFTAGTGSFDQSASNGTFKTGTGAVSLNGDTTIATGKNFTVTNGTSNMTGTTNINTSGSANTNIGNGSTGTVTIGNGSAGAIGVVSGAALTLTGGAASTLSTTTGTLTLQGGSGVTIATPNAGTSSAITIQTGNSTSGTAASVNVDTGTSTSGTSSVNIGVANAGSVVIGQSTTTTTVQGNFTAGTSAGTGTFTNNGSTKNTTLALGDLAAGAIGTAANTVDKYTSFTISPTASGRTYTIPAPTDGAAGRTIYISNINASNTFTIGSTTFNTHSTATLVYDGTGWNFAGMDGGSNNYIQNQTASAQTAGFNINGTGTANLLQAATFDTASSGALAIGTTNATQINLNKNVQVAANQNLTFAAGTGSFDQSASSGTFKTGTGAVSLNGDTTVAAGKSLRITGGNTASRPGSPSEGTLYYDTSTHQLLQYNGSKWKADGQEAVLVAANNSSDADKAAADYIATGTGDQSTINNALTAADPAGSDRKTGKVYLFAGTYTINGSISIPNNTTLAGAGQATLITIPNGLNTNFSAIVNSDTATGTGVTLQDLRLDGNKSNQATAVGMVGIDFNGMGGGSGASARAGAKILNVSSNNWYSAGGNNCQVGVGICLRSSNNSVVNGTTTLANLNTGIMLLSASYNTIIGSIAQGNTSIGIFINGGSTNNTITGNTAQGNASVSIQVSSSSPNNTITGNTISNTSYGVVLGTNNNTVSGNNLQSTSTYGIYLQSSTSGNSITGNKIHDSGGGGVNNGIYLDASDSNTITGNSITDSSATTNNYAINISNNTSDTNYLADNTLGGGSINDAGTGTIYGGQLNSSNAFTIQASGGINLQSNTTVTGTLSATTSLQAPLLDTASAIALNIGTTNATSINLNKDTNLVGNLTFDSGANRTISIGTSAASTAGRQLTLAAGTGGSGTGSVGGDLVLQGGTAGGTNANGGNIYLDAGAKTGSGVDGSIYLGSTRATTIQIGNVALASGTQTVNIGTNNTAGGTTNVTIGNGASATAGTTTVQAKDGISLTTNGVVRQTFNNTNAVYFGNGVTAAAPNNFTISGTGSSTTAVAGGSLTVQGGNATTGNANGGNLTLSGGTGIGTGTNGLVVLTTPTFQTVTNDTNCYTGGALVAGTTNGAGAGISGCTIATTSVNNSSAILVGFSTASQTAAMPDPTIATAGRVVYVTAANSTNDFTLSVNGGGTGNTIAMRQNTTATMIWNGSDWTAAGASSSTTLQSAYDNTLQSAGGAELVVSHTSATNGLTIRDSASNPVNGTLLSVQSSSAANLFSVNGNVTEYVSNAGAESYSGSTTTFPASTWSALTGATVSRNVTTANIATGQGSAQVATTTSAGSGVKNQLSSTLTAGQHYNVSFTTKLSSGTFTDMGVYYSIDGTADSVTCTTGQAVKTSIWTKVNCTFTAPSSGITSSNSINIRQVGSGTSRTFYVDNLSVTIAADYNYATDGTANNSGSFSTNWTAVGTSTVTRNTSDGQEASDSAQAVAGTTANNGLKNKLSINPLTSTLYRVSVYAKLTAGSAFTDFKIRYTPDNGTNFVDCVDYNGQTITTTGWTQITCYVNTAATTVTNPYVQFIQPTAPASGRTFLVDTFSMTLASNSTPNVQIGGSSNGGPTTLFTLDRGASAPIAANNDALLGSMYYDTTLGKLQCYEADGWGACGSSPDNIVTISPEYTNAVLHGTGVGTMTSDLCSDTLNINDGSSGQDTICGSNETYNFYKWTSPQTSAQTYSIYVTYQLPSTFKAFQSGATSIMGRTDNGSSGGTATVTYQIYRNNSTTGLTSCGSSVSVSTGTVGSWQTGTATGAADPSTCGFAPGDSVVFKIDAVANKNANAYIGNLNFTFSNR